MNKPKTSLLRSLIRRYQQASLIEKNPALDVDTILELERTDPYSRRKFIKDSAKALTIIGLSSVIPFVSCRTKTDHEPPKLIKDKPERNNPVIVIIGGGIAGLNCAYQLKKKNIIAHVYEADKKTGGRISSKENELGPGLITEYGGEFIDTNNLDIINLVKELNLLMYDTHADIKDNHLIKEDYYFKNKKRSDKDILNEFKKIVKKLEGDKIKCRTDYTSKDAIIFDNTSLEEYVLSFPCNAWFKDLLIYAYVAEFGMDASKQSALNLIDMISTDTTNGFAIFGDSDERFKVVGGNAKVTSELFTRVKDQVQVGKKLTSIKNSGNSYELSFEEGNAIKADIVVIAIPFTMLRKVNIQLEGISPDKLKCINELGYGQNNKLILSMNKRPWRENKIKHSGYLFHQDIHNGWDSSQMQGNNAGAGSYTVFLGRTNSVKMANSAKDLNLKDQVSSSIVHNYLEKLDVVFKGMKKEFTGNHKAALWSNNPFINASYASYSVGQWTSISGKEFEPVGNVMFAGEHCSSDFQGYMNGGAETGRRVAEAILAKVKSIK